MELTERAEEILESIWVETFENEKIHDISVLKDTSEFKELTGAGYISLNSKKNEYLISILLFIIITIKNLKILKYSKILTIMKIGLIGINSVKDENHFLLIKDALKRNLFG